MVEFEFHPIPRVYSYNAPHYWLSFGFGLQDGLYSTKGTWYVPNYANEPENAVESLKYRINSSDSSNGAFLWVIESLSHESLHSALFDEIGLNSRLLDNIDKDKDGNYIISKIQGSPLKISSKRGRN